MSAGRLFLSVQDLKYIFKIFENKFGKISLILFFVDSFLLAFSEKLILVNSFLVHMLGFGLNEYFAMGVYNSIGEGFKVRVATYMERIQFRREAPWTRSARTARVST